MCCLSTELKVMDLVQTIYASIALPGSTRAISGSVDDAVQTGHYHQEIVTAEVCTWFTTTEGLQKIQTPYACSTWWKCIQITSCETTCLILNFSQLQDVHFAVVTVERAQHRGRWQEDGRLCRLVLLWGACCCWQFRKYYTKRASFPSLEVQWLSTQPSAWRSILRQGFIWGVWLIVHCWGIGIHLSHFTCYISVWHTELPQICIMWETWLYDVIQFEVSRHLWTLQDTSATYQCRHAEDKCVLISEFGWVGMLLWPPNRDQTLQLCRES